MRPNPGSSHLPQAVQPVRHPTDYRRHDEPVPPVPPGNRLRRRLLPPVGRILRRILPIVLWRLRNGRCCRGCVWRRRSALNPYSCKRGIDFFLGEVLGLEEGNFLLDRRRGDARVLQDWGGCPSAGFVLGIPFPIASDQDSHLAADATRSSRMAIPETICRAFPRCAS
jgi:hypothetical protein